MSQFEAKQSGIIAIAYQSVEHAQLMSELISAGFPILADDQHLVGDAYGVFNLLNDNTHTPSIFILDKKLSIIWSYIGKDVNDRPSAAVVLEKIP